MTDAKRSDIISNSPSPIMNLFRTGLLHGAGYSTQRLRQAAEWILGFDGRSLGDPPAARWTVRKMALSNPLLDFDTILFVKRVPPAFPHMSDQYLGWWSQPGGGLYVLEDFRSAKHHLRCLTEGFAPGNVLRPDISYDGRKVLFAYCRYHPGLSDWPDKLDKSKLPEDSFYHLFEMNVDGTDMRQLTDGPHDDIEPTYLPDGDIVFYDTGADSILRFDKIF